MNIPLTGIVRGAAVLALAASAAACDRGPATSSEYNNSGASALATPGTGSRNEAPVPPNPPPNITPAQIQHDVAPQPAPDAGATNAPPPASPGGDAAAPAPSAGTSDTATTTTQTKSH